MNDSPAVARASHATEDLTTFVGDHYPRLVRLATLVTGSPDGAEDAVQAAFERAWRKRGDLRDPSQLRSWLDRIVVREAIRGRRRHDARLLGDVMPVIADHGAERVAVQLALRQLTTEQRAAAVVHLYLGYTVPQAADLLGVPAETVRSRLRVARSRLRALLADEERRS
jgi:RNA polymerase sigma-70 factor (ECF subfamily)